jgi:hypothetical protein
MNITITVYDVPITRPEEGKVEVHEEGKEKLTDYVVEIKEIREIEALTIELNQEYQKELTIAKHNLNKTSVKKKIITNT